MLLAEFVQRGAETLQARRESLCFSAQPASQMCQIILRFVAPGFSRAVHTCRPEGRRYNSTRAGVRVNMSEPCRHPEHLKFC